MITFNLTFGAIIHWFSVITVHADVLASSGFHLLGSTVIMKFTNDIFQILGDYCFKYIFAVP